MTQEEEQILETKQRANLASSTKAQLIDILIRTSKENRKLKSQTLEDRILEMILDELKYDTHGYISDRIDHALDKEDY